jgi:uncharacterized protein YjbJ (UPF0337 family)
MGGRAKEIKGSVKEAAGRLLDNEQMEAEGRAEKEAGRLERKAGGTVREAKGKVKEAGDKLLGARVLEARARPNRFAAAPSAPKLTWDTHAPQPARGHCA